MQFIPTKQVWPVQEPKFNLFSEILAGNVPKLNVNPIQSTTQNTWWWTAPIQPNMRVLNAIKQNSIQTTPKLQTPVKSSFIPQANATDFNQDDINKFRDLLSKWVEPERAKKLILQVKWQQPQQEQWLLESIKYKPYTQEEVTAFDPNKSTAQNLIKWQERYAKNIIWWAYNILPWIWQLATWVVTWVTKDMYNKIGWLFWMDTTEYDKWQAEKTNALITWIAKDYVNKYWSSEWFTKALIEDPTAIVSDVLTVAWIWLAGKAKLNTIQKTALETQKASIIEQVKNATTLEEKSALIKQWIEKSKQIAEKTNQVETATAGMNTAFKYDPYVVVPSLAWKGIIKWTALVSSPIKWITKQVIQQAKTLLWWPDKIQWIQQAIRPYVKVKDWKVVRSNEQITNEIKRTNELIKQSWDTPTDLLTYRQAVEKQLKWLWEQISTKTKLPLEVDLSETSWKLRELANKKTVELLDKWESQKLLDLADDLEKSGKIWVWEAEYMNQFINDTLKSMPNVSETYKRWLNILVKDLREKLDITISNIPWEFKQIKKDYWALRNILWDTVKREIVYNRANPEWLITWISKIEWLWNIWSGLLKILWLDVKWWVADIGKWLIQNEIWTFIKTKNDPNYIIKQIFSKKDTQNLQKTIKSDKIDIPLKSNLLKNDNANNNIRTGSNTSIPRQQEQLTSWPWLITPKVVTKSLEEQYWYPKDFFKWKTYKQVNDLKVKSEFKSKTPSPLLKNKVDAPKVESKKARDLLKKKSENWKLENKPIIIETPSPLLKNKVEATKDIKIEDEAKKVWAESWWYKNDRLYYWDEYTINNWEIIKWPNIKTKWWTIYKWNQFNKIYDNWAIENALKLAKEKWDTLRIKQFENLTNKSNINDIDFSYRYLLDKNYNQEAKKSILKPLINNKTIENPNTKRYKEILIEEKEWKLDKLSKDNVEWNWLITASEVRNISKTIPFSYLKWSVSKMIDKKKSLNLLDYKKIWNEYYIYDNKDWWQKIFNDWKLRQEMFSPELKIQKLQDKLKELEWWINDLWVYNTKQDYNIVKEQLAFFKKYKISKEQIKDRLSNLDDINVEYFASKITNNPTQLAKVKEVIKQHLKKYWNEFKNYMSELVDKIVTITWTKLNLLGKEWIGVEKTKMIKFKSAEDLWYKVEYIDKKPKWYYWKHFSEKKVIELYTKWRTPEQIQNTLDHEIWHIIDYQRRWIVADSMWDSIRWYDWKLRAMSDADIHFRYDTLKKEAESIRKEFPTTHTLSTTQKEIYADAYKIYKNNPEKLEKIAPNIYKQLDEYLNKTPNPINKAWFINPTRIFTDIKNTWSKILKSMQDPNIPKAKAMYEKLVSEWVNPMEAQRQIVAKYWSNSWKGSKAWFINNTKWLDKKLIQASITKEAKETISWNKNVKSNDTNWYYKDMDIYDKRRFWETPTDVIIGNNINPFFPKAKEIFESTNAWISRKSFKEAEKNKIFNDLNLKWLEYKKWEWDYYEANLKHKWFDIQILKSNSGNDKYVAYIKHSWYSNYTSYKWNTLNELLDNITDKNSKYWPIYWHGKDYITDYDIPEINNYISNTLDKWKPNIKIEWLNNNEKIIAEDIARAWNINKITPHWYGSNSSYRSILFNEKTKNINKSLQQLKEYNWNNIKYWKKDGVIYFDIKWRQVSFHIPEYIKKYLNYDKDSYMLGYITDTNKKTINLYREIPEYKKDWIWVKTKENTLLMTENRYDKLLKTKWKGEDYMFWKDFYDKIFEKVVKLDKEWIGVEKTKLLKKSIGKVSDSLIESKVLKPKIIKDSAWTKIPDWIRIDNEWYLTLYHWWKIPDTSELRYNKWWESALFMTATKNEALEYAKNKWWRVLEIKIKPKDVTLNKWSWEFEINDNWILDNWKFIKWGKLWTKKYPDKIYKAISDVWGYKVNPKDIDGMKLSDIEDIASWWLRWWNEEFKQLIKQIYEQAHKPKLLKKN